jgi:ubiquinone/menaquinone biosynthesis C-methylase UbiE
MKRSMRIEGIPGPAAWVYSVIVGKNPLSERLYHGVAEEIASYISSGRLLDIGTGPGYLPLKLAAIATDLDIVGVDISPAMVRIATKNAQKSGLSGRVRFQVGDAATLPFDDGYFDLVVSTMSLHHWSRPVEAMREIWRVLKPNGQVLIYDLKRDLTAEDRESSRRKYGRFMEFLLARFIRIHSSVTSKKMGEILSLSGVPFSQKSMDNLGVVLRVRLVR